MKTIHHHSHLAPEEIQNIKDTIEFCQNNSMRRVSVLGYAQIKTPKAYAEYFYKRNPNKSISHYFNPEFDGQYSSTQLKQLFAEREQELKEKKCTHKKN